MIDPFQEAPTTGPTPGKQVEIPRHALEVSAFWNSDSKRLQLGLHSGGLGVSMTFDPADFNQFISMLHDLERDLLIKLMNGTTPAPSAENTQAGS